MVDELVVAATLLAPREAVFARLRDVEDYGRYCRYVDAVRRVGDGGIGTEYELAVSWWRVGYDARLRITGLDPPNRIGWRVIEGADAAGEWRLAPTAADDPAGGGATDVTLTARFDPDSGGTGLSLPAFVPCSAVVERARPVVASELDRIGGRLAADVEGRPRSVAPDVTLRRDVDEGS